MSDSEATKSSTWAPSASIEAKKLRSKQDATPWNIAGTGSPVKGRTRGKKVVLFRPATPDNDGLLCSPCPGRKKKDTGRKRLFSPSSTDDNSAVSSLTGGSSSRSEDKAPSTRFIGETSAMIKMMEEFMVCPLCNDKVSVTMTCIGSGIATFTRLQCTDKTCSFVHVDTPLSANVPLTADSGSEKIKRNTDFAVNVLYVLGLMASGDGGTEAARLLGLLGLPNSTTMQARTFGNVEKQIGPVIQEIADELIVDNIASNSIVERIPCRLDSLIF